MHDALLIESDVEDIPDVIATTRRVMGDASAVILNGYRIPTEHQIVMPGEPLIQPKGAAMWARLTAILSELAVWRTVSDE